jgi:phytoene desaturase
VALRQLQKLGLTNVEKRIRFERVITPADWEHHLDIHRGATFNLAHSFSQMLHLRPRNQFDDCERLYLVGGGTHQGSGLPVIFESARISSRLLLKRLGVGSTRPRCSAGSVAGFDAAAARPDASRVGYSK